MMARAVNHNKHLSLKERIWQTYRENKPSGIVTMWIYRYGHFVYYKFKVPLLRQLLLVLYVILDNLWVKLVCSSEFPARCKIGRRLKLPHGANGIIIHGEAVIGDDVVLFHQVTIGEAKTSGEVPTIGSSVTIGTGAKVLGNVSVGAGSKIGANAVVLTDVPPNRTAVGVPAVIKRSKNEV